MEDLGEVDGDEGGDADGIDGDGDAPVLPRPGRALGLRMGPPLDGPLAVCFVVASSNNFAFGSSLDGSATSGS